MLCVIMKRKSLQQEETPPEGGLNLCWETNRKKYTSLSPETLGSPMLSHVPSSKTASVSSLSSTNSSESAQSPFQSLCQKDDDQNHEGEHPMLKATVTVGGEGLSSESPTAGEAKPEIILSPVAMAAPPQQHDFTRTLSVVSGDISDSERRNAKRPRFDSPPAGQRPTPDHKTLLLATVKDSLVLSPLHVFVRQQIEVFEASEEDLKQPAPGRRIPIQLNQVGIRCIHCKHQIARERKKRAVCYPSSAGRIYHSVSDMKFAHFPCQEMCRELQEKFAELKDEAQAQSKVSYKESGSKRIGSGNASTAQYYHDSACELGMTDGKGGIFAWRGLSRESSPAMVSSFLPVNRGVTVHSAQPNPSVTLAGISKANALQGVFLGGFLPSISYPGTAAIEFQDQGSAIKALKKAHALVPAATSQSGVVVTPAKPMPTLAVVPFANTTVVAKPPSPGTEETKILLASEMDQHYLAPIHCFVRRHVEVFAANEQDLAAPAPGRKKPILLGQVGIRCVHCARLPVKERVKRAICYPPATAGLYHAVSNMKFDHFKHCKGMPKEAREEFEELSSSPSSSSSTGSKRSGANPRPRVSNSTAQFYHDSALRMGLHDTPEGIRFKEGPTPRTGVDPAVRAAQEKGDGVPEGMEALIIAATDPEVRAAHEKRQSSGSPVSGPSAYSY